MVYVKFFGVLISHPWKRNIIFSATWATFKRYVGSLECNGHGCQTRTPPPEEKSNPSRVSIESWWPLNNTERKSHFWLLHPGLQLSMCYCWRTKCCISWADINLISNECNMFSPSELVNRMYLWTDCIQMGFFPQSKLDRFFEKGLPSKSLVQKVGGAW